LIELRFYIPLNTKYAILQRLVPANLLARKQYQKPGEITTKIYSKPRLQHNNTTTVLRPFVRDYPGEPIPEETLTHPPS